MGNEYNRFNHHHQYHHHYTHHHHHHHHAHHLHINPRATFLPVLCSRPSIKDVQVPSNASFSTDSSASPKISCMGQVKRSNKVSGFPITSQTNHSSNNIKYSKLKKLFSGKNLVAATPTKTTTAAPAPTATSCPSRSRRPPPVISNVKQRHCVTTTAIINLVELDPPLPVIKRVPKPPQQGEEESLWKRRSGGAALKGLQLKQVSLPRHQTDQSTSV